MEKKTFFAILGLLTFLYILCSGLGILRTALAKTVIRDDNPNKPET